MFQAYFSAGLTRTAKPKKTKYVQLLFLYTYFIFDNLHLTFQKLPKLHGFIAGTAGGSGVTVLKPSMRNVDNDEE